MRWHQLTERTVNVLRKCAEEPYRTLEHSHHRGMQLTPGGRPTDERWTMRPGSRSLLERAGFVRYRDGAIRITEAGREYLDAVDAGDAPRPEPARPGPEGQTRTANHCWRVNGGHAVHARSSAWPRGGDSG